MRVHLECDAGFKRNKENNMFLNLRVLRRFDLYTVVILNMYNIKTAPKINLSHIEIF